LNSPFSLAGLQERPFYLKPEQYDLLIYPAEWRGEISLDASLTQELSDVFYSRPFGRLLLYNLWTLFVKSAFLNWFDADVALGYRNLLTDSAPDELPTIFYNEGFSLLQTAKLKELRTETDSFRATLDNDYVAIPLIPAALGINGVTQFFLGEPKDPSQITVLLKELRNFLN
jgi:hypothetical protein